MRIMIVATLAWVAVLSPALAGERYDRRLEAAAISIVATKMGDLRGGFSADDRPVFTMPIDPSQPTHLSARRAEPAPVEAAAETRPSSFTSF